MCPGDVRAVGLRVALRWLPATPSRIPSVDNPLSLLSSVVPFPLCFVVFFCVSFSSFFLDNSVRPLLLLCCLGEQRDREGGKAVARFTFGQSLPLPSSNSAVTFSLDADPFILVPSCSFSYPSSRCRFTLSLSLPSLLNLPLLRCFRWLVM